MLFRDLKHFCSVYRERMIYKSLMEHRAMNVLVTGGTGFIGSSLVSELIGYGCKVFVTGTSAERILPPEAVFMGHDFSQIDWKKIGTLDVLFHQAAINDTTFLDETEMLRVNLHNSQKLIEESVAHGCTHIVYASSTAVYGDVAAPYKENGPVNPLNPYAKSKLLLDHFTMDFAKKHPKVTIVGLRYCNVYGPGEEHKGKRASMVHQLAVQMLKGNPTLFKSGEQKRDYLYVKDAVRANILASQAKKSCIVNCGSGKATSFNDLVMLLNEVLGLQRKANYIDNPYEARYQNYTECDMSLAQKMISFKPLYGIKEGILDLHAYMQLKK